MKKITKVRYFALIILLGSSIAAGGSTSGFFEKLENITGTQVFSVEHGILRDTNIEAVRGPLKLNGEFDVTITGTFKDLAFLDGLLLYVGNDTDDSDYIESSEWTLVGTATITEDAATKVTTALMSVSLTATADKYRLVIDCKNNDEDYFEEIGDSSIGSSDEDFRIHSD